MNERNFLDRPIVMTRRGILETVRYEISPFIMLAATERANQEERRRYKMETIEWRLNRVERRIRLLKLDTMVAIVNWVEQLIFS